MSNFKDFFSSNGGNGLLVPPPKKVRVPGAMGLNAEVHRSGYAIPCRAAAGTYFVMGSTGTTGPKLKRLSDESTIATIAPSDYIPADGVGPHNHSAGTAGQIQDPCYYDATAGKLYIVLGYAWADSGTNRWLWRLAAVDDVTGAVTFPGSAYFQPDATWTWSNTSLGSNDGQISKAAIIQGGKLKSCLQTKGITLATGHEGTAADNKVGLVSGTQVALDAASATKWVSPLFNVYMSISNASNRIQLADFSDGGAFALSTQLAPDWQLLSGKLWIVEDIAVFTAQTPDVWRCYDAADLDRYFRDLQALAFGIE